MSEENNILDSLAIVIDNFPNRDNTREAIVYNKEQMARKNSQIYSRKTQEVVNVKQNNSYTAGINKWNNIEEENTHIVFLQLPVGYGGRNIPVAIGTQDYEAKTQGLKSVIPLTEDDFSICDKYKWRSLDEGVINILAKHDKDIYTEILEFKNNKNPL